MLKMILIAFLVLVAVVLVMAALKPNRFRVARSVSIKAPPEKIFPHINNFHAWEAWSPWEKIDPTCKRSYSGIESGVGAIYGWSGNKDIGEGRMEIVESTQYSKIVLKLDFIKPFEAHNMVEFLLQPQGDSTAVTQAMYGASPFISKLMGMCFNMDKMVGGKYEEGLASLKAIAEK
jgi:Polyketide cyclase / dehydrase and lipid transport